MNLVLICATTFSIGTLTSLRRVRRRTNSSAAYCKSQGTRYSKRHCFQQNKKVLLKKTVTVTAAGHVDRPGGLCCCCCCADPVMLTVNIDERTVGVVDEKTFVRERIPVRRGRAMARKTGNDEENPTASRNSKIRAYEQQQRQTCVITRVRVIVRRRIIRLRRVSVTGSRETTKRVRPSVRVGRGPPMAAANTKPSRETDRHRLSCSIHTNSYRVEKRWISISAIRGDRFLSSVWIRDIDGAALLSFYFFRTYRVRYVKPLCKNGRSFGRLRVPQQRNWNVRENFECERFCKTNMIVKDQKETSTVCERYRADDRRFKTAIQTVRR